MAIQEVDYKWFILAGAIGFVGKLIHIWIQDKDNDGKVDEI